MVKEVLSEAPLSASNPIFAFDTRNMRWLRGRTSLRWYGLRWLLLAYVLMIGPALAFAGREGTINYSPIARYGGYWLDLIQLGPLLVPLVADIVYVLSSIHLLNNLITSGEWDALALTPIDQQEIISAKHAFAQLRSWHIMLAERAVQTAPIVFILLWYALPFYGSFVSTYIACLIAFGAGWFAPLWRMQAGTALGLALSSRVRNASLGILAGLSSTVLFALVWLVIGALFDAVLRWLYVGGVVGGDEIHDAVGLLIFCQTQSVLGWTVASWIVKHFALRYTLRAVSAFHEHGY